MAGTTLLRFTLSLGQRAVLRMLREREGAVRMNISPEKIGVPAATGIEALQKMGLIQMTPLVGSSDHDVRLTPVGVQIVIQILDQLK